MDQFFSDYLERLDNLDREIHKQVEALPEQALDWVPGADMNSVDVLVTHIAGSLRYWIGDVALGDSSGRVREREFQAKGASKDDLLSRLDASMDYVREALSRLSLADLDRGLQTDGGPKTVGAALLRALGHGYLHLGHLEMTRQLWEQRSGK